MASLLTKIFGSRNDRLLKKYRKTVKRINALEAQLEQLPDDALRATLRLPDGAPLRELADRATRLAGTAWPERVERAGLSGVSPDGEELTERPAIMHPCHGALRAHAQ